MIGHRCTDISQDTAKKPPTLLRKTAAVEAGTISSHTWAFADLHLGFSKTLKICTKKFSAINSEPASKLHLLPSFHIFLFSDKKQAPEVNGFAFTGDTSKPPRVPLPPLKSMESAGLSLKFKVRFFCESLSVWLAGHTLSLYLLLCVCTRGLASDPVATLSFCNGKKKKEKKETERDYLRLTSMKVENWKKL